MKLRFLSSSVSILALVLTPQIALSELTVTTKSGRQYTVPVNSSEVEKIEFTSDRLGGNWQGKWETSEGMMFLSQTGKTVTGTYSQDNGKIEGQTNNNLLVGYWIEDGSARECSSPKSNSYYWGRISWELDANGQYFNGKWSYCNDEPNSGWSGKK